MNEAWRQADDILKHVTVYSTEDNDPVTIEVNTKGVHCIGIGTDAAVFTLDILPGYAFKLYSDMALDKKEVEAGVYERLKGSEYFSQYYGKGDQYIVISYESGITLLDCLLEGVPVPEQVILEVEEAREFVRSCGMNPRDIHLKNVLLQDGHAKVLDVSEYVKDGDDKRWDHLVWAYNTFYASFSEVKIPAWILITIKKWYYKLDYASDSLEEFAQRVTDLFLGWKK